jgi:glutaredoxin-like protein
MSLISPSDQERLRLDFDAMSHPVRLLFFTRTNECETCPQTRQILDALSALTAKISIEEVDLALEPGIAAEYGIDHVPAVAVIAQDEHGVERDSKIRFLGMPAGYEFASLIRAVLLVGGGTSQLSVESRARIAAVDRPIVMHVFTTPTCPHCPSSVTLAHEIAWANSNVTAYAVEVTEFPDLARQYRVTGVPKTVVEGGIEILGALPEADFVEQALAAFAPAATSGGSFGSS